MKNDEKILMSRVVINQIGLKKATMLALLCHYRMNAGHSVFVNMKILEEDNPFRSTYAIKKYLRDLDDLGLIEKRNLAKENYYAVKESVYEDYMISCFPRNENEV